MTTSSASQGRTESNAVCKVGCTQHTPHLNLAYEQYREGVLRESEVWGEYPPLGDPEEWPFTTDGTPDESPDYSREWAWYRDMSVEVTDPLPDPFDFSYLVDGYTTGTFESTFRRIFNEAFNVLVARQRKYGKANIEEQGPFGVLQRIEKDKLNRIKRAFHGCVVNGEIVLDHIDLEGEEGDTLQDALIDVANYALIILALVRGEWGRPLESEL